MTTATSPLAPLPPDDARHRARVDTVAANVGRLRRNSGLDLESLAVASGVAIEDLRAVEAGLRLPSLRTLWALADAFEVPFGVLLSGPATTEAAFGILRAADASLVDSDGGFRSRPLSVTGDPREPEVYEVVLAPGWREDAAPHATETFEHIVVIRGTLELHVGDAHAVMGTGDAVFFRADRPHTYRNPSSVETALHLTMTYAGDWSVAAVDFS